MRITVVYADNQFSRPIRYVFDLMLSILGVEYEILPYPVLRHSVTKHNLLISYGREKADLSAGSQIHIYQSKLFSRLYKTSSSMPRLPLKSWSGLPVIYEGDGNIGSPVVRTGNMIETNVDIIASSLFMLSRYEEILLDERDRYDRFPATASIAYKEGFLTRPIVNEYIDLLWEWIDSFDLACNRKELWNGRDFAACLTHDIDTVKRWHVRSICSEALNFGFITFKKRKPLIAMRRMVKNCISVLSPGDPYWNFDRTMALEEHYGFSSSFYFFGGGNHRSDAPYSIHDSQISRLLSKIQDRGHEIGLHGSFDSYNNLEMLRNEKENLEIVAGEIFSIRQHYLRFDAQKTFAIHEKLGIKCDVTLGFAAHEGFRAGICLPFHPYNLEEDRPFDVLEIPLTIMDGTLSDAKYRGLHAEEAWQSVKSLLETVKRHRGCIVLLWHNTHLDTFECADFAEVYERTLYWIACNNGLGLSAKQICRD